MTFLPVVERELRVAARKRATFWLRVAAALVALLIAGGFLAFTVIGGGVGTASLGRGLFATLTWLCLAAALSAGLFFTSDSLSEEKREGTIGFLFLTDLRGYDVIFGKLLATSLRCFYALLAVLPILAITLLMGGVGGAQFWRTSLALVNAMFVSLAAGIFVSALSRDSQKALAGTLLLLILLVAGGLAGDATLAAFQSRFHAGLSLSSPGYVFAVASAWSKSDFWPGLLVSQAIGWLLLGLACVLLPRSWQERAVTASAKQGSLGQWWRFGGAKRRARLRQKLLDMNPVLWLACRERWQMVSFWLMTILLAGGVAAICAGDNPTDLWIAWNYFGGALTLFLYLGITSQASRFLVDAKRSGLLEVLLATPLTSRRIVLGQWHALLRMLGPPMALFLAAYFVGTLNQQKAWGGLAATATAVPPTAVTGTNSTSLTATTTTATVTVTTSAASAVAAIGAGGSSPFTLFMLVSIALGGSITVAANLAALVWFGMWMGLNSNSANLATLKTIVFVQVIPWFVIAFGSMILVWVVLMPSFIKGGATAGPRMMVWYPLISSGITTVLSLAKDVLFCLWSRKKLYSEFHTRAARVLAPSPMPGSECGLSSPQQRV